MRLIIPFILALFILASCYKEITMEEPEPDAFDLVVVDSQQQFIYNSYKLSYSIEDPSPRLYFNGELLDLREIRVRGKATLKFRRKSYAVFLDEPIKVYDRYGRTAKRLDRFKLLGLQTDYTYIENRVAFGLLQEAGLMPLFYKFVQLRINDDTQGIYFLVEDPEEYHKETGSEFILRRGYHHTVYDYDYDPDLQIYTEDEYMARFNEIYDLLPLLEGEELYRELAARLDMDSYFRKMGIDYLLKNGDSTDELYFYAPLAQDALRFNIIAWDYDDIFSDRPHEVGRINQTGTIFGTRVYYTPQDVKDVIGEKLIFSIEDDLDYAISQDDYLYGQYEKVLKNMFKYINGALIDRIFLETENELSFFFDSPAMIEQSKYDRYPCDREKWEKNLEEKSQFLQYRLESIRAKLNN